MTAATFKLAPVEPTEDMVIAGFESAPCAGFTPIDEMDAYEAMSGCQQAAHRARLCYAAMLAAAPDTAPELSGPTAELVKSLTDYAGNPGYSHNDYADTMKQAAHCIGQLIGCVELYQRKYAESLATKASAPAAPVAAPAPTLSDARMAQFILTQCIHNMVVANQAAWIEWQHGAGAEAAMQWIENGLIGPGHIPDAAGMDAQAYFNANEDQRMDPAPAAPQVPT